MAQQTAVEWLYEFVQMNLTHEQQMQFEGLFQQAKAMEKEQIIYAYKTGAPFSSQIEQEEYYNETYKKWQ